MEQIPELNKPGFRPKFVSEFSMGELDFQRYNDWLKFIEKYSGEINSMAIPNLQQCQGYFSGLNVLYKQWRPIIAVAPIKEEIDGAVKYARDLKRIWERSVAHGMPFSEKMIFQLVDLLDSIHTRLMEIKQVIGLGIVVRKNMTTAEKIRRGVRGDKDFANLPEA